MTLHRVVLSGLCAGLLMVGSQSGGPARNQEAQPTFRVSVDLVQLEAVVTGAKGEHVTDLKPEEFELRVDGVPQRLLGSRYIRIAQPAAARSATARTEPAPPRSHETRREEVRRTIVFLVDDGSLKPDAVYSVRKALKTIIDREVQPGDLVALVRTMSGEGALEQFTADKSLLYAAVDRIRWLSIGRGVPHMQVASPGFHSPDNSVSYLSSVSISRSAYTFDRMLQRLRGLPGKKAVIFISQDWPMHSPEVEAQGPLPDVVTATHTGELVDAAVRAGATVYTIDPTALDSLNPGADYDIQKAFRDAGGHLGRTPRSPNTAGRGKPGAGSSGSDDDGIAPQVVQGLVGGYRQAAFAALELSRTGLRILAENTGGLMYADTNDISWGMSKFFGDQQGYYQLEFKPESPERFFGPKAGVAPFHQVRIRVKRKGVHVRYHAGFIGKDEPAPEIPTGLAAIDRAISSPFPESAINVRLAALFNQPASGAPQIDMTLNIKAADIAFTPSNGRQNADLELVARTVDEKGEPLESVKKTITLRLAESSYDEAREKGLTYHASIPASRPGFYEARIVVRDAKTDRLGSARQLVEVPDLKKGRLAMAGLVAFDPLSEAEVREFGIPSQGAFERDDTIEYSCRIFNAKAAPEIETVARVLREGKPVLVLPAPELAALQASLRATGSLPLESLEPGDYVLQLAVYEPATKSLASQWTDFTVLP